MNRKEFLIISFTIFLTVLAWVLADIYHASKMRQLLETVPAASSLEIRFDEKVFDSLRAKDNE